MCLGIDKNCLSIFEIEEDESLLPHPIKVMTPTCQKLNKKLFGLYEEKVVFICFFVCERGLFPESLMLRRNDAKVHLANTQHYVGTNLNYRITIFLY